MDCKAKRKEEMEQNNLSYVKAAGILNFLREAAPDSIDTFNNQDFICAIHDLLMRDDWREKITKDDLIRLWRLNNNATLEIRGLKRAREEIINLYLKASIEKLSLAGRY